MGGVRSCPGPSSGVGSVKRIYCPRGEGDGIRLDLDIFFRGLHLLFNHSRFERTVRGDLPVGEYDRAGRRGGGEIPPPRFAP